MTTEKDINKKFFILVVVILLGAALGFRVWGLHLADIHVDEPDYTFAGDLYLKLILKGDIRSGEWAINSEHPPVAKWIYGTAFQAMHQGWRWAAWYRAPKLAGALIGTLSIFLLILLGREMYGPWEGLLAGSLAAFLPHLLAHHRIIGLETPTVLFWLATTLCMVKGLKPGAGKGWWVATGVFFGLTVGVRYNNGLILFGMIAGLIIVARRPTDKLAWPGFSWATLGWPVIGFLVWVAVWPYLWLDPIKRMFGSLLWQADRKSREWFLGELRYLPWYYYLTYLAATSTPPVLAGVLGWLGSAVKRRETRDLLLLVWLITPLALSVLSFKQDGVRYVIQCLPFMALAASVVILRLAARSTPLAIGLGSGAVAWGILACVSYWPYHLDYYNFLAGTPKRIAEERRLRFRWWGEGAMAALSYVNANLPQGARVAIGLKGFGYSIRPWRPDFKVVGPDTADYFIAIYSDWNELTDPPEGWDLIFEERFKGLPFSQVYKRP